MALTLGDRPVHQLSVSDVQRMLENGVLDEDSPVELLEGVLVTVSPKSPEHAWVIDQLDRWLLPLRLTGRHLVRIEQTLAMPASASLPEPDLYVLEGEADRATHPASALFVVEVSISSLRTDREVKAPLYAAAGVPEYWIVDVEHRRLEVRREPADGGYSSVRTLGPQDAVAPVALDLPPLALSSIF